MRSCLSMRLFSHVDVHTSFISRVFCFIYEVPIQTIWRIGLWTLVLPSSDESCNEITAALSSAALSSAALSSAALSSAALSMRRTQPLCRVLHL